MRFDNFEISPDQLTKDANTFENTADEAYAKVNSFFEKLEKSIGADGTVWKGQKGEEEQQKIIARHNNIKTGHTNIKSLATGIRAQAQGWVDYDEQ